jgi:thiamine-phosphate pyrophosphorylase
MASRSLLYYITDGSQFAGDENARRRALLAKIVEAARAGVDYIQLREKDLSARALEALAQEAVIAVRENSSSARLLINSRTDVALAVEADGVHLRSEDVEPGEARGLSPDAARLLIGISCHTPSEVLRAETAGADFAVFAPVFEKRDIPGIQPKGCAELREACAAKIPVLALGGVTILNAGQCLSAGAAGVAAIRLFQENKIEEVVHALRGV